MVMVRLGLSHCRIKVTSICFGRDTDNKKASRKNFVRLHTTGGIKRIIRLIANDPEYRILNNECRMKN